MCTHTCILADCHLLFILFIQNAFDYFIYWQSKVENHSRHWPATRMKLSLLHRFRRQCEQNSRNVQPQSQLKFEVNWSKPATFVYIMTL